MKRAFSLLEVVILVGVLALLAAILFPVLARRNVPSKGRCASNLKQIGLGFAMYTQDYGGRFLVPQLTPSVGWADMLQSYVKSRRIFLCPATSNYSEATIDYFYNRNLSGVRSARIRNPVDVVMTGDGDAAAPTGNSWAKLPATATATSTSPLRRHFDGANFGFVDGHVKWYSFQKLPPQQQWNPLSP
ncbi:type II secretion system protein [bacterium]|nr:MAG: type II secretion system protein [bacterium]